MASGPGCPAATSSFDMRPGPRIRFRSPRRRKAWARRCHPCSAVSGIRVALMALAVPPLRSRPDGPGYCRVGLARSPTVESVVAPAWLDPWPSQGRHPGDQHQANDRRRRESSRLAPSTAPLPAHSVAGAGLCRRRLRRRADSGVGALAPPERQRIVDSATREAACTSYAASGPFARAARCSREVEYWL